MLGADGLASLICEGLGVDPADVNVDELVSSLDEETLNTMLAQIVEAEEREKWNKFTSLFPDKGPLRRQLYPKHMEFFEAGATKRERLFMAGNRVGKSVAGGFETTCHLTGRYPEWWKGRKFRKPIRAWVAGDTNETTRDILQHLLLGDVVGDGPGRGLDGSGLVPRECLGKPTFKRNVADMVDTIPIKHDTGRWSSLAFKSFDQGRKKFQGTAKELIWLDEECPMDVYGECLIRTATTRGIVITTFTPLSGLTELVLSFMPEDMKPDA